MNLLNYFRTNNVLRRELTNMLSINIKRRAAQSEAVRYSLAMRDQVRLLNRAIQRRNRTIERLRARLAAEQPTNLPELARTKEGRALYNHAYNKGRIRGRRDVLDAVVRGEAGHDVVRGVVGADMEPITNDTPTPEPVEALADHPQATIQ